MRHCIRSFFSISFLVRSGLLVLLGLASLHAAGSRPGVSDSRTATFVMVVLDFANNSDDPELGRQIAEIVRVIVPDFPRFRVVDRGVLRSALEAKRMSIDKVLDSGTGIEAARELKAEYLLVGTIGKLRETHSLNLKLIDTATGTVVKAGGVEFRDMMEIRQVARGLLVKILNDGQVSGKPVITEFEFKNKKKNPGVAMSLTIGSTIVQAGLLGGAVLLKPEYNPSHVFTSLALLIPSITPIYTENWNVAPYVIGFSIGSGVFNFVGYALYDSYPSTGATDADVFKRGFGVTLFVVAAFLKVGAVILDVVTATASVDEYNEQLRKNFFITLREKSGEPASLALAMNLRF